MSYLFHIERRQLVDYLLSVVLNTINAKFLLLFSFFRERERVKEKKKGAVKDKECLTYLNQGRKWSSPFQFLHFLGPDLLFWSHKTLDQTWLDKWLVSTDLGPIGFGWLARSKFLTLTKPTANHRRHNLFHPIILSSRELVSWDLLYPIRLGWVWVEPKPNPTRLMNSPIHHTLSTII